MKFVRQQNKKIKKLQTIQKEGEEKEQKIKAENQSLLEKLKNAEEEVFLLFPLYFIFYFSTFFPLYLHSPFDSSPSRLKKRLMKKNDLKEK